MSERPSPANGKRNVFWGTLHSCSVCGRCLCYLCHPRGPCADERPGAAPRHQPSEDGADRSIAARSWDFRGQSA